jgi:hypothetical protein
MKDPDCFYKIQTAEYLNRDSEWTKMKYNPRIFISKCDHGLGKYYTKESRCCCYIKLIYDTKENKLYTFDEFENENSDESFIDYLNNEVSFEQEQKAMAKVELEQRKREQTLKKAAEEEQQRMNNVAEEQKIRDYLKTIREELEAFDDNINTNIIINELRYIYEFNKYVLEFEYHYMVDDTFVEVKKLNLRLYYTTDIQTLRFNTHILMEETKEELADKIHKKILLKKFEKEMFNHVHIKDEMCSICRMDFDDDANELKTCKHVFHKECLIEWLKTSNKHECPLCRKSVFSS